MDIWSGVESNFGVEKWATNANHSDKARPCFRKYQEQNLSFCRCGCEFLLDVLDLYFWGNYNGTKLRPGTCGYHQSDFVLNCLISKKSLLS